MLNLAIVCPQHRLTMQKIAQRTEQAQRAAVRRLQKKRQHVLNAESWERNETKKRLVKANSKLIVDARKNRKEAWAAGALAPRQDVGEKAISYGTMDYFNMIPSEKDPEDRLPWYHIVEGDRVVVTKGRDKGRIGTLQEMIKERNSVSIKNVNMVDVQRPEWIRMEDEDMSEITTVPQHIPIQDVKLVYPLPDPQTGVPRDVIIDRLEPFNRKYDKVKKEWTDGERLIPGTNTIIPWPEKGEEEREDNEDDTLRIVVDEQTFRPFLLNPPMPTSVIDELRNKYSKFRTRHDYEYVEKKEQEQARVERRKDLVKTMRTPLQELAELRAQQKKETERKLTPEQLAKIGEVIAREQMKATSAVKQLAQ